MQKTKNLLIALTTIFFTALPILIPVGVSASIQGNVCHGANSLSISSSDIAVDTGDKGNCPDQTTKFNDIIRTVLIFLSAIVGTVAVVMLIVGGFRYITSGGNSEAVGKAKNTIIYALIGLVIVALAQIIVQFVLHRTATA
jgi:hypothetical protein